jgi:O-antigen ligase
MKSWRAFCLSAWRIVLEAGLLLVLPLVFYRGFPEQFSSAKFFLTRLLIIFGLAAWGVTLVWRRGRWPKRVGLLLPLGALALVVLLSCANSPVPRFSLYEVEYFLCGPVFFLLLVSSEGGEAVVRRLAVLATLGASAVAVVVLLQWAGFDPLLYGGYQVVWGRMPVRMRLFGTFGNPNFVAGYLIAAIFLAMALGVASGAKWQRTGWWTCALAMLAAILGSGSRGAWLGLAAGLLIASLVWIFGQRQGSRETAASQIPQPASASTRCVTPALLWLAAPLALYVGEQWLRLLKGRVYLWRFSWPMFAEHPVLGGGYGTYQLRYLELQAAFLAAHPGLKHFWTNNRYVHNDPLQLLLEAGLLGFAALVWVLWAYGREARRAVVGAKTPAARIWVAASVGAATAILADSLFNFQFAVAPTFMLLFALLAFPTLLMEAAEAKTSGAGEPGKRRWALRVATTMVVLAIAAMGFFETARHAAAERSLALALGAERSGDLNAAEDACRRGLAQNPLNGRLHFSLARVFYQTGRLPGALAEARLAERTYADSHLEVLKARIQDKLGMNAAALQTYRHALALDPTLRTVQADIQRLSK